MEKTPNEHPLPPQAYIVRDETMSVKLNADCRQAAANLSAAQGHAARAQAWRRLKGEVLPFVGWDHVAAARAGRALLDEVGRVEATADDDVDARSLLRAKWVEVGS